MVMVQNSLVCRFFMALWAALTGAWEDSAVGRGLRGFCRGLAASVRNSAVCRFLWREGAISKSWPGSVVCRVLTVILNIPCAICRWIYKIGKNVWDGSLAFRAVSALGGAAFLFVGAFLALMLMVPHGSWDNRWALMGTVALVALFALGAAARPSHRLEMVSVGPYLTLFMAFVCYAFLCSLNSGASLRFVGFYITAFLLTLLVVSSVKKYEQLQLIAVLAVAGLTIAALYGCYQGIIGVEVVPNQQDMAVNAGMPGRVYSFFDNPNNFAELLAMLMPLLYALFLNAKGWRGKVAALFSFGVCLAALGFTLSRSSWLGFTLAAVVFVAFWNWKLLPLLVVLGLCCIPILPESIYNRILTIGNTKDSSTSYRFAIYKASGVLMEDYWLRGVGLGSDVLKATFKGYPPMFDGNFPIHTHNNYLQVWAETGLFGALAFLGTLLYQLKSGVKAFLVSTDKRVKNLLAAAIAGFCGILLISVAEYTWFYPRNMFVYFFLFGIIAACIKLAHQSAKTQA
ncbi:hypothetical protein CE91St43_18220 [Oscillospiraceae bacterium]|nr:hypothetical protein CE91St43_18220 [Oscillospiraceae bacterium]